MNYSSGTPEEQQKKDGEHIKLLAIFHFVIGGLSLGGIAFLGLHYAVMRMFFTHPEQWTAPNGQSPPPEFFHLFLRIAVWFYLLGGLILLAACLANLLSGFFLLRRKHRMFSLVVAGLDCVQIPFGTVLGVLTIMVLLRDSVRQAYGEQT